MCRTFLLLLAACGLAWPATDAKEIIRQSIAANDADWKLLPEYSHRETDIAKSKSSRTYEVLMIDGSPYRKLIAINGAPVGGRSEETKLKKETMRRKRESAEERADRIAKYERDRNQEHFLMNEMIKAFDFHLIGNAEINGHAVYVLEATPRPDYRPPNQKAKVLTGMKGELWIDQEQYHWAKVEAEVTRPVNFGFLIARVGPGTSFELDQEPVEPGVWLPSRFVESVNAKILGLASYRTREEETYSDYHR